MVDAALEGKQLSSVASRSLRENNERLAEIEGAKHRRKRVVGATDVPSLDEDALENILDKKLADNAALPVVGRGDRACPRPEIRRQRGPQENEIGMACVIGDVDALRGGWV